MLNSAIEIGIRTNHTLLTKHTKENIFLKYKRNKKDKKPQTTSHHTRMLSNPIFLSGLTPQRLFDESMNLDHLQTLTNASMCLDTEMTHGNQKAPENLHQDVDA